MPTSTHYVITGTSRGIGLEMTRQLLKAGNRVYALARHPDQSKELTSLKQKYPNHLHIFAGDVTSDKEVSEFARNIGQQLDQQHEQNQKTVKKGGQKPAIDVLINNAGTYGNSSPSLETLSLDDIVKTIETNTISPMRVTKAFLPYLRQAKQPKVVHITSLMGSISDNAIGKYYGYRMSKAALNMFHKSFSVDYPQIISLVIHPGWVQTAMGGPEAPTPVDVSARGILGVVEKATASDSGKFLDYEGNELPW